MEWLGRACITFTHHTAPLPIPLKPKPNKHPQSSSDGGEVGTTDLLTLCERATPPCHLNPLLLNGHLQTMYTAVQPDGPPVWYKRQVFEQEDPAFAGSFAVDFAVGLGEGGDGVGVRERKEEGDEGLPPRTSYFGEGKEVEASEDSRPMVVALHGLSGGSYEVYLRHVLAPLINSGNWEACVLNSRGCAEHKITTGILFNARATWDLRQIVLYLRAKFPHRPLFGMGFSLGANILTNYIGEEGTSCLLAAAVVVSTPFNLEVNNVLLHRSFFHRNVYSRFMGGNLKKLVERHKELISTNSRIDLERVRATRRIDEFDREVQLASWGYPTVGAYYRDASSVSALLAARIPLFAISARDDPIAVDEAIPYDEFKQNPFTVLATTSLGGHLGWFELGRDRWHAKPCVNFLNAMAFEADLASIQTPRDLEDKAIAPSKYPFRTYEPMTRKLRFRQEA